MKYASPLDGLVASCENTGWGLLILRANDSCYDTTLRHRPTTQPAFISRACFRRSFSADETQVACISCLPGYYSQLDGGEKNVGGGPYACRQCEAGTFSSSAGATACDLCSLGTYQPGSGKSSCLQCDLTEAAPSAQTTVMEGSYHRDQCVACLPGIHTCFYF